MNTAHLAWRNLLRNRRRSLLTLAAISVGSIAVLLFGGYVAATVMVLHTEAVRTVGHLQIQQRGHLDFGRANPGRFAVRDYQALTARLRAEEQLAPLLAVVTPVLQVQGVAGNFVAGVSSGYFGLGVVPGEQAAMQTWDGLGTGRTPGVPTLRDDAPDAGVIGRGLAQLLALCDALAVQGCKQMPGEPIPTDAAELPTDIGLLAANAPAPADSSNNGKVRIELLAASPGGAPNVISMQVLRAEQQGVREIDKALVSMPLGLAQRMIFGSGEPAASALVVQLKDSREIERARQRIGELIADVPQPLEVLDFHVINPSFDQIIGMFTAIFRFIALLMGVVALFSVANAVNMAVSERVGEIGTLRALGLKRDHVRRMFVAEGALLGLIGGLLGTMLAITLDFAIRRSGMQWTPPGRTASIPLGVDVLGDPRLIIFTVLAMIVLAAVSSWLPARRAARMEIAEALRHV